MNRRAPLALLLAIALGAGPLLAQSAPDTPKPAASDEARARYERGLALFEEGAYDAALIEFQRAYELAPSYKILYNIAKVSRQVNDYASAARAYERYLSEGGKEIAAARRTEVERELLQLRARVATLEIATSTPGADISIDDVVVGVSPLKVVVNAGRRRIGAASVGHVPVTRVVTVAGADSLHVDLDLGEPTAPPAASSAAPSPSASVPPPPLVFAPVASTEAPMTPSPPPPRSDDSSVARTISWIATGAFAIGAGVTGGLALSASSRLKSEQSSPTATRASLDDDHSKERTLAVVSDVFSAVTLFTGGVALYLTLKPDTPPSMQVGVGPSGVHFSGSF